MEKKSEILGPPPFGAPPFGAPPFWAPPFWAPLPGDPPKKDRCGWGGKVASKGLRRKGGGASKGASKGRGFEGASKPPLLKGLKLYSVWGQTISRRRCLAFSTEESKHTSGGPSGGGSHRPLHEVLRCVKKRLAFADTEPQSAVQKKSQ